MSKAPSKPKQKRTLLFRTGKPNVRNVELINEFGYGNDMGVLWAAYKVGGLDALPRDMEKEDLADTMLRLSYQYDLGWFIEDRNAKFASGVGPIGFMVAKYDGWTLEPHFEKFPWASKRNLLRGWVGFLQMMKYEKEVGCIKVFSNKDHEPFFKRLKDYGVTNYVGRIPGGSMFGDQVLFYARGRKKCNGFHQH